MDNFFASGSSDCSERCLHLQYSLREALGSLDSNIQRLLLRGYRKELHVDFSSDSRPLDKCGIYPGLVSFGLREETVQHTGQECPDTLPGNLDGH